MRVYWLTDRDTGEVTLVDDDTVERVLGVEMSYVEWCVELGGGFENEAWRVAELWHGLGGKRTFTSGVNITDFPR